MITDTQVNKFLLVLQTNPDFGRDIHVDIRKALEAYEQSRWVKFDEYDESTYPKVEDVCTTILGVTDLKNTPCLIDFYSNINPNIFDGKPFILFDCGYSNTDSDVYYGTVEVSSKHLVAWQPLPVFKE